MGFERSMHRAEHVLRPAPVSLLARAWRQLAIAATAACALLAVPVPSCAQHGNYLLGTTGLLGASQPPEGIYYQNIFSYYNASGTLLSDSKIRELDALGHQVGNLTANLRAGATLTVYVDQNIIGMTTPFKLLGANYGFFADIPFDQVHGTGDASLDLGANLKGLFDRQSVAVSGSAARGSSGTATFNIADIYLEPINFGWHFSQADVYASFGFFAPTGSVSSNQAINNGLGRWAEMFGLGAVVYLDQAKSWSISALTHYLTHQTQQGHDIRVGDDLALEWGVGKTFRPDSWKPWVAQLDMGVIGYAQWQVTNNTGSDIPIQLRGIKSNTFAVGPEIAATTRFGRFFARYEFEFGSQNAPQGQIFLFGLALLVDPFKK